MDLKKYGPWALIVGGSEGVGESFARKLAADGFKLVLVARRLGPLDALAGDLRKEGCEVRVASVDMTGPDALHHIRVVTDDIEVGLLIYNAGVVGLDTPFLDRRIEEHRAIIGLNVCNPTELAFHFGGLMRPRGRGGMIIVGSTASYMGVPGMSAYSAVKAFERFLCEGLWAEFESYGVDVLHLCLGYTATAGAVRSGADVSSAQTCDDAAQDGLDNLAKGPLWIPKADHARIAKRMQLFDRQDAIRANGLRVPGIKTRTGWRG